VNKALAGTVAVAGIGTTCYGRLPKYDADDRGAWALKEAIDDIDGLIINRIPDLLQPNG
jgi:hypothetical protein